MAKKKDIIVRKGVVKRIAEEIGCSTTTVGTALSGARQSELVERIRELAVRKYGGR